MGFIKSIIQGFFSKANFIPFVIAALLSCAIIVITIIQPYVSVEKLYRDASFDAITGLASHLGNFLWLASVVICFFTALSLNKGRQRAFILFAGSFTLLLFCDDFFKIHEGVWPAVTGLSEKVYYVLYVVLSLMYLLLFKKAEQPIHLPLLLSAFGGLGFSMMGDVFGMSYVLEDGAKLVGISLWLAFHVVYCAKSIRDLT